MANPRCGVSLSDARHLHAVSVVSNHSLVISIPIIDFRFLLMKGYVWCFTVCKDSHYILVFKGNGEEICLIVTCESLLGIRIIKKKNYILSTGRRQINGLIVIFMACVGHVTAGIL